VLNWPPNKSVPSGIDGGANQLSLYEQYGSVAYGVVLQIVPQPQHAQEILVDLFASPELQIDLPTSARTTCTIIRLAREKALDYRQRQHLPVFTLPESVSQPEQVFNLLFYQNQSHDSIAEQLQIQRSAVSKSIREFFGSVLPY
jgi:hypothetical protein